jgi:predicted amidophosphoribosyltransferase
MELQSIEISFKHSFFRHYFLYAYLPQTAGVDPTSRSLLKFKRGVYSDIRTWTERSLDALKELSFSPDTIILRALGHDETTVRLQPPASLDHLGHALAALFQCRYLPSILTKSRPTLNNKGLSLRQRLEELQDVYTMVPNISNLLTPITSPIAPSFLLIDDIFTTGTTLRAIIRTLRQHFPHCPISLFTLARASYKNC